MVTFSLDDNQLRQICVLAEPLPPPLRSELLRMTAAELAGAEPGDGSLARGDGRSRQGLSSLTPPDRSAWVISRNLAHAGTADQKNREWIGTAHNGLAFIWHFVMQKHKH